MFEKEFAQFRNAVCVLVIGLNAIGLGLWANGANYPSNPAWGLIQAYWDFQTVVLIILLGVFIFWWVLTPSKEKPHESVKPSYRLSPKIIEPDIPLPPRLFQSTPNVDRDISIPKPVPPVKPPPTPAELKRKALKQITGKEY